MRLALTARMSARVARALGDALADRGALVAGAPFALVFLLFFLIPLALIVMVSFWNFNEYELIPAFTLQQLPRASSTAAAADDNGDLCVTLQDLPVARSSSACWCGLITLVLGFAVAYFLAFHVRSPGMQTLLFVLCTMPVLDLQRDPHDLVGAAARAQRPGQPGTAGRWA